MRRLRTLNVPFYSPLIPRQTNSPSGRVRTSYVPLFSNYVFIYGDRNDCHTALTTGCVSRCLSVPDPIRLTHDLRQIRQLIRCEAPLAPETRLQAGDGVRVRRGPFSGLEGVLARRTNRARLIIAVDFLQQGASVEIDECDVEVLD